MGETSPTLAGVAPAATNLTDHASGHSVAFPGMTSDGLVLAGEHPEATRAQWRELVAGVLRKSGAASYTSSGFKFAFLSR